MTATKRGIVLRHKESEKRVNAQCGNIGDGSRISFKGQDYHISRGFCQKVDCRIQCTKCGICMHDYTCTCRDYNLHLTICKHIHFFAERRHMDREERVVQEEVVERAEDLVIKAEKSIKNKKRRFH